jgi:hypothetical protein
MLSSSNRPGETIDHLSWNFSSSLCLFLPKFKSIAKGISAIAAYPSWFLHGFLYSSSSSMQAVPQASQIIYEKSGMTSRLWLKTRNRSDMKLLFPTQEPDAAVFLQRFWYHYFRQTKHKAIKQASLFFSITRNFYSDMVDT